MFTPMLPQVQKGSVRFQPSITTKPLTVEDIAQIEVDRGFGERPFQRWPLWVKLLGGTVIVGGLSYGIYRYTR